MTNPFDFIPPDANPLDTAGPMVTSDLGQDLPQAAAAPRGRLVRTTIHVRVAGTLQAAHDVLAERRRQVDAEGWSTEHDDSHVNDEIAALACFYAMPPGAREWPATETGYGSTLGEAIVPNGWTPKVGDRRQELVKAGALILAEIERLDRAESKPAE